MSVAELRTEAFAAEREWTVEGIPVLSASVLLPRPADSGKTARRVLRYYQLQCRSYLRYCERCLFPQAAAEYRAALASSAPLPCFQAALTYQVTYSEGGLWSLYTQSRETFGPGQGALSRWGDTWDLAAGCPVPLGDFFPPGSHWRRRLLARAAAEMETRERAGVSLWHPDWRQRLRRHFNAQNYYLTAEGLAFFYPMYAIAPPAEGIPVFLVPYGQEELRVRGGEDG